MKKVNNKNKLFTTEEEMVNQFCDFFKNYKLEKEVKIYKQKNDRTFTDIVLTIKNIRISFEAKLNDIITAWMQALKNKKLYDYSYIVLPEHKKNIILKKHIDYFKKHRIGIVLINNKKYEFLHKVEDVL